QLEGVEGPVEGGQGLLRTRSEGRAGTEALIGRLGPIVDSVDASALASLVPQALDGLEEVGVQAHEAIDAAKLGVGGASGVAIVADQGADDGPVFLLDLGTVVLPVGPAPREGDALAAAIVVQRAVDELGDVVGIQAAHGDREPPRDLMEGGGHTAMALPPQRLELDPAGGDIDGAERGPEEAGRALAAVRDEIDLEKARRG